MNLATRRSFLQDSTALATSVVIAQVESVCGEESLEPIRIAVIGTGARGCDLIRALTTIAAAKVVAVCEIGRAHV